jgi:hypothetical protein
VSGLYSLSVSTFDVFLGKLEIFHVGTNKAILALFVSLLEIIHSRTHLLDKNHVW